jgi:Protein of Unknown function (DUF2784)
MWYRLGADALVLVHAAFVVFVVAGGFLALRWPKLAWIHLPAAAWGALIEFAGWICPLTPLENSLRIAAGQAGYSGGFIEHYIVRILYPPGLTTAIQITLGIVVVGINVAMYSIVVARRRRHHAP